ncbi:beta-ketoacyl synthase chain length factor [Rhodoferax sp. GW822-FHT02A01]|uniref:beta-ketoacyl synthase chain length factor n=1 Tax=Rhodoferax sp. GW822-FHT02A01 TaxID=3141537 RepID=UPI00315C6C60
MSTLSIHVDGIGLFGPGLSGWSTAVPVLTGEQAYVPAPMQLPPLDALPAAERRRVGTAVKLALSIGFDAVRGAGADAAQLATVFSSSAGDCDNCHNLLEALASADRSVSPTRFHNSVHNAASGYWSIATGCMAPSTSLSAFDATFAAALLEAATQALDSAAPCLLVAYDTVYPEPLHSLRPIASPFGVAMVLNPQRTEQSLARLEIGWTSNVDTSMADAALESLRRNNPSARSLPLLQQLARGTPDKVVIEYLDTTNLALTVLPCQ